ASPLVGFADRVTAQVSDNAVAAESRLATGLEAAAAARERVAALLLEGVRARPRHWQLHGALLTEIDRILAELDPEHRSRRLMEELDRTAHEDYGKLPAPEAARRWLADRRRARSGTR
ncbi:hypothetical protein ACFW15_30205, partial [Streptomyces sp. NPDC058953]